MKQSMFCFLIVALLIICLLHVSTLSLASPPDVALAPQKDKVGELWGVALDSQKGVESKGGAYSWIRKLGRIGSRPPNCRSKCGRCSPCVATQIPTASDQLGIQYANYEPEGWTCKCGSTFFNP